MRRPSPLRKKTILLRNNCLLTIEHFEQEIALHLPPETISSSDEVQINVFLVGREYRCFIDCDDLGGYLSHDRKEVYRSLRGRHAMEEVVRKVKLIRTNTSHPTYASRSASTFVRRYSRKDGYIARLSPTQADELYRKDEASQRESFLSARVKRSPRHSRYTFGDAFCGVGGSSAGARKAGLEIKRAFDSDPMSAMHTKRTFRTPMSSLQVWKNSCLCGIFHVLTSCISRLHVKRGV